MHNLLPLEEVEEVFAAGLHPKQPRLALRPCNSLCIEPALGRGDAHWLAAEVLLVIARRAVNGVSFGHTNGCR
jgi:hypothetical protein